jgi:hypothetical protein
MKRQLHRRFTLSVVLVLALAATQGRAQQDYRETFFEQGRQLRLDISAEFSPRQRENLVTWINFIAGALLEIYGHWPRQQWQVTVLPAAAAATDPIPWAQVHRGKIDRIEFFVAPHATLPALKQDWTGYHELAHLLIPYRGWGDTWFSEGLASYYQNVLQARAGVLSEQQAWQNMYDGFMRGVSETQFDGHPLSAVSDSMREKGGFMRVYWSGAWYFLASDVRLRQQSGGSTNLDGALANLNQCCADEHMSVVAMVNKLDELNEVVLFAPLYEQARATTTMPAFERIFASLGISVADGKVTLQQEGPGAQLRRQIVQPKPL